MAFFKFRKTAEPSASAAPLQQSIESIRQRAKYRLVGATVLVLIGVVGLPMLFDKQPRPIAVDTPIDIPDRQKVPPLAMPPEPKSAPVALAASQPEPVALIGSPALKSSAPQSAVIEESSIEKQPLAQVNKGAVAIKNDEKTVLAAGKIPKPAASAPAVTLSSNKPLDEKQTDAAKAQALLEGKSPESNPAAKGRFVVQVGAFAEASRAQEVRMKLERAGLKTYTHVAETKDGKRIRVRVGPFDAKADAEKVASKIKKLNLQAALLTL